MSDVVISFHSSSSAVAVALQKGLTHHGFTVFLADETAGRPKAVGELYKHANSSNAFIAVVSEAWLHAPCNKHHFQLASKLASAPAASLKLLPVILPNAFSFEKYAALLHSSYGVRVKRAAEDEDRVVHEVLGLLGEQGVKAGGARALVEPGGPVAPETLTFGDGLFGAGYQGLQLEQFAEMPIVTTTVNFNRTDWSQVSHGVSIAGNAFLNVNNQIFKSALEPRPDGTTTPLFSHEWPLRALAQSKGTLYAFQDGNLLAIDPNTGLSQLVITGSWADFVVAVGRDDYIWAVSKSTLYKIHVANPVTLETLSGFDGARAITAVANYIFVWQGNLLRRIDTRLSHIVVENVANDWEDIQIVSVTNLGDIAIAILGPLKNFLTLSLLQLPLWEQAPHSPLYSSALAVDVLAWPVNVIFANNV